MGIRGDGQGSPVGEVDDLARARHLWAGLGLVVFDVLIWEGEEQSLRSV